MNITQEMIEEVERQIKHLSETMPNEALPVRNAMYGEMYVLGRLKEAYEHILMLEMDIEELHSK